MKLHREGLRIVLITFLACLVGGLILWFLANFLYFLLGVLLLAALLLFVAHFFRLPNRSVVHAENAVYSPADGTIVAIETVEEPEVFGDTRIQVSVFMSVWNVHANWYPMAGTVSYVKYHPGRFLVAWHPKSSTENERSTVVVDRADGKRVLIRQIAGAVARRIITYSKAGENVKPTQELGFIKFGSRVDLFFPPDTEVLVKLGQRVQGMTTPLARM